MPYNKSFNNILTLFVIFENNIAISLCNKIKHNETKQNNNLLPISFIFYW